MKDEREKDMKELKDKVDIYFKDYASLNKNYSKHDLAEVYKKIITDIESKK